MKVKIAWYSARLGKDGRKGDEARWSLIGETEKKTSWIYPEGWSLREGWSASKETKKR